MPSHEAIVTSRKNSWNGIAKRQHEVLKVYTFNETSNDLLLIGKICADLTNGRTVEMEFIGQFILTGDVESDPQIVSYKSWGVSIYVRAWHLFGDLFLHLLGYGAVGQSHERVTETPSKRLPLGC